MNGNVRIRAKRVKLTVEHVNGAVITYEAAPHPGHDGFEIEMTYEQDFMKNLPILPEGAGLYMTASERYGVCFGDANITIGFEQEGEKGDEEPGTVTRDPGPDGAA